MDPLTVRSTLLALSQACCLYLHWDLCASIYPSLSLPSSLTFSVCLSLSPWPVWSVIEGAVFTWPTGMEGTLCALWRQIALLAPLSLYLSFTSLLLLSSYSAHPFTTLLVSPLYHHSLLSSHPILTVLLNYSIFSCGPSTSLKYLLHVILKYCHAFALIGENTVKKVRKGHKPHFLTLPSYAAKS